MDKKRIELKKKQMLDKRRAKFEEIQKRKQEMESNLGLQNQFFDQLISRVQQPTFLTNTVDMNLTSCFVEVLKDTKELQKTQYEFLVPFLPVIAWQLAHVDLSWTLLQPQNNHQQLEHITSEILRYSCRIIKAINDFENTMRISLEKRDTSLIGKRVMDMCKMFNKFYTTTKVLDGNDQTTKAKVKLVEALRDTLLVGFKLLCIDTLREM